MLQRVGEEGYGRVATRGIKRAMGSVLEGKKGSKCAGEKEMRGWEKE